MLPRYRYHYPGVASSLITEIEKRGLKNRAAPSYPSHRGCQPGSTFRRCYPPTQPRALSFGRGRLQPNCLVYASTVKMDTLRICDQSEVAKHNSRRSCWVVIGGIVYDLTSYLEWHPGGAKVILQYAGRDATQAFEPIHPGDTLHKHVKAEYKTSILRFCHINH